MLGNLTRRTRVVSAGCAEAACAQRPANPSAPAAASARTSSRRCSFIHGPLVVGRRAARVPRNAPIIRATMAVNIHPPKASELLAVNGVRLGIAKAHVRKPNRKDLLVLALDEGSRVAGVFTRNRFAAAPVQVCKSHLASEHFKPRAIVVNTGVANAGTGEAGPQSARAVCAAVGSALGVHQAQVLPLSTGVIMEPL